MSEIIKEGKIKLENNNYTDNIPLGAAASNVYFVTEDKSLEDINYENRQSLKDLQEKDKELSKQNNELSLEDEKIKQTIEDMQENCKKQDKILQDKLDIIDNKINNLQSENITFEDNIIDIQVQQNSQKEEIKKTKENYTKVTTTLPTIEKTGTDLVLENSTNFINKKFNINGQYLQEVTEGTNGTLIQDKNIIVKDVNLEKARLLIKGSHKQEKTNGRQLLNPESLLATTIRNGITFTNNGDGTFNVNGTATADTTLSLWNAKDVYEANHYFGLYSSEVYNVNTWNLSFAIAYSDGTATKYITPTTPVNAINENINTANVVLYIPSGVTINKNNVKVMLYKDINTQLTEYEKYTGGKSSPNLVYQQGVKTVGNNVNILPGKEYWEQGAIDNNTGELLLSTTRLRNKNFIEVKPKTNYFASIQNNNYAFVNIILYDKNGTYIKDYYSINNAIRGAKALLIAIPADCYNIKIVLMNADNTSNITVDEYPQIKAKFEKGEVQTSYSTYSQGSVEIVEKNNNIAIISNLGLAWEYITDGVIKNKARNNGIELTKFSIKKGQAITINLMLISQPTIDSTLSILVNNTTLPDNPLNLGDLSKFPLNQILTRTYIATEDTEIKYKLYGNANSDIFEFKFWVNFDETLEYKKAEKKTYLLPVQQEMLEGDYINSSEHHTWQKLILKGNENIKIDNISHGITQFSLATRLQSQYAYDNTIRVLSNYFCGVGFISSWENDNSITISPMGRIRFMTSQYATIDEFKLYIKAKYDEGNPVIVYYKLATPIELKLTDEQKSIMQELKNLQLYTPITSLYSVDEETPLLSLRYNYTAAMPSSENISEIKATGDNVNYFNKDTLTNYILNEETGESTQQLSWRLSDFIPIEKGNYIFSWDSDNSYFQMKVCYYDKDKVFLSGIAYGENNIYSKILEIPEDTKYTRICYSINVNGTPVVRENIKLEKGTVKTPYSNYNQGSVKLSVKNQNFLSNLKKTNTSSGLNNSFDNGIFSSKGIATQTWSMITIGTDLYLKAGTYALSISNLDYSLEFRCHMSNGVSKSIWLDPFNLKRSGVFDYDITSISLIYHSYKVGDSIDFTGKLQFEPGDTFNPIIIPKGQDFLIPVQQELLSEDKIDKTEYHAWKKIVFTGDETLSLERINDYDIANILYKLPENELGVNYQVLSNSFVAQNTLIAATQTEGIYLNETSIYFRIDAAIAQDSTRFKNWLKEKYNAGTPVIVYYKLKEPQNLELTIEQKEVINKIKKCEFYDNITYINNDIREGQIPASLDIEYFNPSYLLSIIKPYVNNLIEGREN